MPKPTADEAEWLEAEVARLAARRAERDRELAAAERRGYRRAVEALRDTDAFEAWFRVAEGLPDEATWGQAYSDYLESLTERTQGPSDG